MKVLCNKATKKIESFSRWDDIDHNPTTHIQLFVSLMPDMNNERLNDTEDGLRPATQGELNIAIDAEKDTQIEAEFTPALIAVLKAISPANAIALLAQAKAARKAEL